MTVPQVRQAAAEFGKRHPALTAADLRALADALFATDFHDLRSLAIAAAGAKARAPAAAPICPG